MLLIFSQYYVNNFQWIQVHVNIHMYICIYESLYLFIYFYLTNSWKGINEPRFSFLAMNKEMLEHSFL